MTAAQDLIGQATDALDTPALLVDLDAMAANIARIVGVCREAGVRWRPHVKAHKTPQIAHMQIAAGAHGITCAKLGEAEVMAAAGIRDILIANQIVGPIKLARLVDLARHADPIVAVDDAANVAALGDAAAASGTRLSVVIEVDIGMRRAGVQPGPPVAALAEAIARCPGLRLRGLMAWESQAVTIADPAEKARVIARAIERLVGSADACRRAGHPIEIVSCGGTGTFPACARQPGVTEVQVGGAIFSDMHYVTHYHTDFICALTLLATVTSRPNPARIIVDAGRKAMSGDAALPKPIGLDGLASVRLSAEHATIELEAPSATPRIGDRIAFVVGYSDTTVHLHETIVGIRGGRIEAVWPVAGRGRIK